MVGVVEAVARGAIRHIMFHQNTGANPVPSDGPSPKPPSNGSPTPGTMNSTPSLANPGGHACRTP